MAAGRPWRRLVSKAYRFADRVPAPVRRMGRRAFPAHRVLADKDIVQDWSTPLFGSGATGPDLPVVGQAPIVNAVRPQLPESALHCLIITESIDVGGMDEVVAFLARGLPRHGIRTTVLHAPLDDGQQIGRLGQALRREGVEVLDYRSADGSQWLKALAPDVVSVHGAANWAVQLMADNGLPSVETLHGMHSLFGAAPEEVRDRSDWLYGVVAVSELVRQQYLSLNPTFAVERVVTVPNGVDHSQRQPPPREAARAALGIDGQYVFVSLARHCLQKNSYGLIAAFDEVAAQLPGAHLVIAGRPDDLAYAAAARDLRNRCRYGAAIQLRDHASDPALLLAAADGFVLDSFFEGWSLASMEALCAGLPVAVADVGGAREQLNGGVDKGFLVTNPIGDPLAVDWRSIRKARFADQVNRAELVQAMISLVQGRDRWLNLRHDIAAESVDRFSPQVSLRKHAAVLTGAAQERAAMPVE
jgi:glycosyltransferase involved in cell wall biosynthesis